MFPIKKLIKIKYFDQYLTKTLKNRSRRILRLWSEHCEYIIAQRFRRGQQMLCLYRRIWDDQALRRILQHLRKQVERHAKGFMLSGIGITTAFDWDSERINYESVRKNFDEFELVKRLRSETIHCDKCGQRLIIDCKLNGIVYCTCNAENTCAAKAAKSSSLSKTLPVENQWLPYIERQNIVIWRREEKPGLYAYKVYAIYDDISAEEFLHVQTDTEYRRQWDKTAISLEVIDTDPVHRNKSHIIYWEMQWPKLFANRDYVYNRRFFVDRNRKLIIIVNKSIDHPSSPKKPNIQRVKDYWSYMVIRSTSNSLKTPGVEYVLTYFDNPGVTLPQSVTSWVAQKQMPEFLQKLHIATLDYAKRRRLEEQQEQEHHKQKLDTDHFYYPDPGYEYPPDPEFIYRNCKRNGDDDGDDDDDDFDENEIKRDNNNSSNSNKNTNNRNYAEMSGCNGKNDLKLDAQAQNADDSAENAGAKTISWWRYLLPFHYFV